MMKYLKRHINFFSFIVFFIFTGLIHSEEVQAASETNSSGSSKSSAFANRTFGEQYKGPASATWDGSPNATGSAVLKAPALPGDPGGELEIVPVEHDRKTVVLLGILLFIYSFSKILRRTYLIQQKIKN